MQPPTFKPAIGPQARISEPEKMPEKTLRTKAADNEALVAASRSNLSDDGNQASDVFEEAAVKQQASRPLQAELPTTGPQRFAAASLASQTTEVFEIGKLAEGADGGRKAKIASTENDQRAHDLADGPSGETGERAILADKIEAGQIHSHPPRYTKSVDNPVQGPLTSGQGAEIAARMLRNMAHLDGKDLILAGGVSRHGGEVGAAQRILDALEMTKGMPGQVFVYNVDDEPVAVMKGNMRNDFDVSFHIEFVVSDRYTRGGGAAMIEKAVNVSLQNGGSGVVTLEANSSGAVNQYKKLGFSTYSPFRPSVFAVDLKLDPRTSDQWKKAEDQYFYTGNMGMRYVTGLGPR